MSSLAEKFERNRNLLSTTSQTLAIIGLDKIGRTTTGKMLTPAVWVTNYTVNGELPDSTDVGLWAMGLSGGVAGPAAIFTGVVKSMVDDDMSHRLKAVKRSEEVKHRRTIFPCFKFAMTPPLINAIKIASMGGTAWQHPNGLWVYILHDNGEELEHVPNFKPNRAVKIYQPKWPLQEKTDGRYVITINRGL